MTVGELITRLKKMAKEGDSGFLNNHVRIIVETPSQQIEDSVVDLARSRENVILIGSSFDKDVFKLLEE